MSLGVRLLGMLEASLFPLLPRTVCIWWSVHDTQVQVTDLVACTRGC